MTRFVLLMALVSLAFMLGMKKGMSLKSTLETPTWKSNGTILREELPSVQDIIATTQDQNGRQDTGAAINGEQDPRWITK